MIFIDEIAYCFYEPCMKKKKLLMILQYVFTIRVYILFLCRVKKTFLTTLSPIHQLGETPLLPLELLDDIVNHQVLVLV